MNVWRLDEACLDALQEAGASSDVRGASTGSCDLVAALVRHDALSDLLEKLRLRPDELQAQLREAAAGEVAAVAVEAVPTNGDLQQSLREALQQGHAWVTPTTLTLSLLRTPSAATQVLERNGITYDVAQAFLAASRSVEGGPRQHSAGQTGQRLASSAASGLAAGGGPRTPQDRQHEQELDRLRAELEEARLWARAYRHAGRRTSLAGRPVGDRHRGPAGVVAGAPSDGRGLSRRRPARWRSPCGPREATRTNALMARTAEPAG